ncbi:MAG: VWA domain-containing protein [Polyangiaceae bacterium]|nr:VWA domain-containing protein [Polyangiaceae bacterium]
MQRLPYSSLAPFFAAAALFLGGCGDDGGFDGGGGGTYGATTGGQPPPPAPVESQPSESPACAELDASKPLVLYLSSDDSNSMASPARARESLAATGKPPSGIRTYEFLNYFRIDFPAPQGTLGIYADAREAAAPGEFSLQLGVRAPDPPQQRRPMTLTFSIDTSGSMDGHGIERARAAILALASRLQEGDVVNAVTWSTEQNVLLDNHQASGPNDATLVSMANSLATNGGTNLNAGLVKGYELAQQTYNPNRLNRLILISDGGANVGVTEEEMIGMNSELGDDEGIYLVGIGTGPVQSYSDLLMDVVTDAGRGAYVYLDTPEEAKRILADRFDEVMEVAARGVQVELSLPWYFQMAKFYGEEYSTDPKEVKPQHLAPGDAMVFLQTLKACDASVVNLADPIAISVKWQEPITHTARQTGLQTTLSALLGGDHAAIDKGLAIVAFAEALKAPGDAAYADARSKLDAADPDRVDPDLVEIGTLLDLAE